MTVLKEVVAELIGMFVAERRLILLIESVCRCARAGAP
jgi:hypothetical protein